HAFNILDARGAVSTTERARAFGRMRGLSREVAQLWRERRAELGHPLGVYQPPPPAIMPAAPPEIDVVSTLLFEIGTEELPSAEVTRGAERVRQAIVDKLAATRLSHSEVRTYATPRRIVTIVESVAPREPDAERTVRGPRAGAAFDATGNPTKAATGFAAGQRVDVTDLVRVDVQGVEHVAVIRTDAGRGAADVLSGLLGQVVAELRADKNMRWSDPALSFTRPVRWLLALLDDVEVPIAVSSLSGGRTTRVHRTALAPTVEVPSARGYLEFLAGHGIVVDADERRTQIVALARQLVAGVGGTVDVVRESALLDEVANLVEWPTPILGSFAQRYLELPPEILTTVMRKHQRYLPVRDAAGALMPYFLMVANGSCDPDVVRAGNEDVLSARYEDAAFFWRADLRTPPETMKSGLDKLAFEERLGSMADRADRIAGIALALADGVTLTDDERTTLARAAALAKFDLGSQMVVELTSLAGTMAREYAVRAGESAEVAAALYDMEQPRTAGDELPATVPGALLALADRLDLLAGLFAVGASPTGSSDPFGLRRAALGAVAILRAVPALRHVTLTHGLAAAAGQLRSRDVEVPDTALADAQEFAVRRYEQQLIDAGHDHHFVTAVLPLADAPAVADETLAELTRRAGQTAFADLVAALQRVRRIVPADAVAGSHQDKLVEPVERALVDAVGKVTATAPNTLAGFADVAIALVEPIKAFFDGVLVMADDPEVRAGRLGLLAAIRDLADGILDWAALGTALARS
ncbi:MAG TPA: glycine--tRNA ligase subunit beta, partial [Pseudonocardiaceae bacterium]|nr:glycine--tRNA ligase subunit beta [Pseudonocardiaceae bacterium]